MHRARLRDGRDVVVKVQYAEVKRLFANDFGCLRAACCFWTPQALSEMGELRISQNPAERDTRRVKRKAARMWARGAGPARQVFEMRVRLT